MTLDFKSLEERRRAPLTTYRLQLRRGFGFREATALADYLESLGVTDYYTSPLLKARPGSAHGYDITDHDALNPDLGDECDFEGLVAARRARGLGHLLDFVPNHMAADASANPRWRDVLENGPSSPDAAFFDIDWNPLKPELRNKVLLPILGDQYGAVLERGELALAYRDGRISLRYGERSLPIDPQLAPEVLGHDLETLKKNLAEDPSLPEFLSVLTQFQNLPPRSAVDRDKVAERRREREVARGRLEKLLARAPRLRRHVQDALDFFNGRPEDPRSFDALHALLEAQAYRLAYWKTAADEINYRRFFDVNELVGLRMERDEVFDATHRRVLELLASERVTGLRIDHPDGLYDPARYFERLQVEFSRAWLGRRARAEGGLTPEESAELDAWRAEELRRDFKGATARPLYVVAEKILSPGETLDPHWCVDGTSGYDFLNEANLPFVDPRGVPALRDVYERFADRRVSPETAAYDGKRLIMSTSMASELNILADRLNRLSEEDRRSRDFTRQSLLNALREIVACFPVYRTYITDARATADDKRTIEVAVARAQRRNPAMESTIFEFIRAALVPPQPDPAAPTERHRRKLRFAMKLQQYTGAVQAKGVEDTAFYRSHTLISANEVGSDPARATGTVARFHEASRRRAEDWPRSMLATATHDTKHGEDARARVDVLSEVPGEWEDAVRRWRDANRGAKTDLGGEAAPDANDEYFFYQALLGAWDFERGDGAAPASLRGRLQEYLTKACREAKLRTSWIAPNAEYEKATSDFIASVLANGEFLASFRPFARRVAAFGAASSLSRTVLKIASPGVADFYQGTELWDLSLVDPDNRRPVDYAARREKLARLEPLLSAPGKNEAALREIVERWEDGRVKLFVTAAALRCRRAHPDLFLKGSYAPVEVRGKTAENFIAFRRVYEGDEAFAIVPRLIARPLWEEGVTGLGALARGASLSPEDARGLGGLRDVFTDSPLSGNGDLAPSLSRFPVALFVSRR